MLASRATITWALLALLLLTGCAPAGTPYRQFEIRPAGEAEPRLSSDPGEEDLLAAITWIMARRLELPLPANVSAYVYVNQATFVDGLVAVGGSASEVAWEQGRFATAVAGARGIFVRGDRLAVMPLSDRAALLAHELAHISQRHLGGGRRRGAAVWIREGHADWVKYRVLDALGFVPYADSRAAVVRTVRLSSTPVQYFPDLEALARNADWIEARNRLGSAATYGQAFLAVDWLVERHGHARLVEFLKSFAVEGSTRNWSNVYPVGYRDFIDQFRGRLLAGP